MWENAERSPSMGTEAGSISGEGLRSIKAQIRKCPVLISFSVHSTTLYLSNLPTSNFKLCASVLRKAHTCYYHNQALLTQTSASYSGSENYFYFAVYHSWVNRKNLFQGCHLLPEVSFFSLMLLRAPVILPEGTALGKRFVHMTGLGGCFLYTAAVYKYLCTCGF